MRLENERLRKTADSEQASQQKGSKVDLSDTINANFTVTTGKRKKTGTIKVSLENIASQFRLTEPIEESTIEESLRGAVSLKLNTEYEETNVADTDLPLSFSSTRS